MFDGYDTGVLYADLYVGRLLNQLAELGVLDDTVIMLSADHGETLGELNVYCDHHTADEHTARVPDAAARAGHRAARRLGAVLSARRRGHFARAARSTGPGELGWPSFADAFRAGREHPRDHLVLTTGAWTCQRALRFEQYLCIRTEHDGYHGWEDVMLFDLARDPHEQHDLSAAEPERVRRALDLLAAWREQILATSKTGIDPVQTVLREGGRTTSAASSSRIWRGCAPPAVRRGPSASSGPRGRARVTPACRSFRGAARIRAHCRARGPGYDTRRVCKRAWLSVHRLARARAVFGRVRLQRCGRPRCVADPLRGAERR